MHLTADQLERLARELRDTADGVDRLVEVMREGTPMVTLPYPDGTLTAALARLLLDDVDG